MIKVANIGKRYGEKPAVDGMHAGRSARNYLLALAQTNGVSRCRVDELIDMVGLSDMAGKWVRAATAHSSIPRLRPAVNARDLHPGDLVQQCDWTLHVREVTVSHTTVAITVTEFGFPLHYAADTRVQLVACRAEQGTSDPPAIRPGVWKER